MSRTVLIADDVSGDALATLVVNALRGTLQVCAVKAPGFGDDRKAQLQDIAMVVGTEVIAAETGSVLKTLGVDKLGRGRRVEIDHASTTIIAGGGSAEKIESRKASIRQQIGRTGNAVERGRLETRLAKLSGRVALIKVGASTETEMKEKRSRVEDALHATRAAIEEGIGAGGGVAVLRARAVLESVRMANMAQDCGVRIVTRALEEPLRQFVINAGGEPDVIIDQVIKGSGDFGYDAATDDRLHRGCAEWGNRAVSCDPARACTLVVSAYVLPGPVLTCSLIAEVADVVQWIACLDLKACLSRDMEALSLFVILPFSVVKANPAFSRDDFHGFRRIGCESNATGQDDAHGLSAMVRKGQIERDAPSILVHVSALVY